MQPHEDLNVIHRPQNRYTKAYATPPQAGKLVARHILKYATRITSNLSLKELEKLGVDSDETKARLARNIQTMSTQEPHAFTCVITSKKGRDILAVYCSNRMQNGTRVVSNPSISARSSINGFRTRMCPLLNNIQVARLPIWKG